MHFLKRGNSIWLLGFSVWQRSSLIPPFIDHAFGFLPDFPGGSNGKVSACSVGDPGSIPGLGRPLEKEMPTHSSTLAWKIPWTERLLRAWQATVHEVAKSRTRLSDFTHFSYFKNFMIKIHCTRTSLIVQWLRLHAPIAGGLDSIPGQGTIFYIELLKIQHATTKIKDSPHAATKTSTDKLKKNFFNSLQTGGVHFVYLNEKADSSYEPVIY